MIFSLDQASITWYVFFILSFTCIHAFLDLGFGVFENFLGFLDFCELFGLGVVDLMLYAHALHFYCISTMFHAL